MKWLINYFRSLFCKHNWEHFVEAQYYESPNSLPVRRKQIFICTKCLMKKEINY